MTRAARVMRRAEHNLPTAPVASGALLVGYTVAVATGSRPAGGLVLALGGLWCIRVWHRRHGARTAIALGSFGLGAFVASHLLALAIGAWPSVLFVSCAMALVAWRYGDAPTFGRMARSGA